jgi:hypothetical protein
MTFKQFMNGVFTLPARAFGGIVAIVMGDFARKEDGSVKAGKPSNGLFGLLMEGVKALVDGLKYLGRSITGFVKDHKQAIASAFWLSLIVAGAAALTVSFWPAALAAVTGFSIAGISIASLVGTGFVAQVVATAGIAALLTSAAVYAVATISNICSAIHSFFTSKAVTGTETADYSSTAPHESASTMKSLHAHSAAATLQHSAANSPIHSAPLFSTSAPKSIVVEDPAATASSTCSA